MLFYEQNQINLIIFFLLTLQFHELPICLLLPIHIFYHYLENSLKILFFYLYNIVCFVLCSDLDKNFRNISYRFLIFRLLSILFFLNINISYIHVVFQHFMFLSMAITKINLFLIVNYCHY